MKSEIYVSVDVETDGPIPGPHSMLSLGAVALAPFEPAGGSPYYQRPQPILAFEVNLELLPGAVPDPKTTEFWAKHPEAYAATRVNVKDPGTAMDLLLGWCEQLPGKPVFVGYPASFDFLFVYWYLIRFVGRSPFGFAALDMKTMAWVLLGGKFRDVSKRRMPRTWFDGAPAHDHEALTDAAGQAVLFRAMHEMMVARNWTLHTLDPRSSLAAIGCRGAPR